ncbi:MAG: glutamate synthase [Phycisphaerales bacterium]|nr:glutamate synthase [Phycisphaerales bacterium]MCB9864131.1 glutamate synthase [Phycisphaerales bacterium]
MAELNPAPFPDLIRRMFREPRTQDALFELPRRKWYLPAGGGPDLSVSFHGERAGSAVGPAAGPHTQMAQNLLLSYVAGARICELKTVQINDRLEIPRPCIDMTNIGYNVEWSQELLVEQSLREYVAGSMLIQMFRRSSLAEGKLVGACGDWIFDLSVGYDLKGIQSRKVREFLDGMRDASAMIEALRGEIPAEYRAERDAEYRSCLSTSITLSTFHGCPADEIEGITEFLLGECDFDVIVKMNPPTLGKVKLEHLLHDVLGYSELRVNPKAYGAAITFDESIGLYQRLTRFAHQRGRRLGFKFSNTLEVENHRDFFPDGNPIMYLSGQPLHVITMALTDEFRRAVGPDVPISFSAGIDRFNFPDAVAAGFVPVTISTDLLRPGGYGRLPAYLEGLSAAMASCGAANIGDFILDRHGKRDEAMEHAHASVGRNATSTTLHESALRWAGLLNTSVLAELARNEPRYRAEQNRKVPKRIDSKLVVFDCVTCDKCLPVCPNSANFKYPTPVVAFDYCDWVVAADGGVTADTSRRFAIEKEMQIACYADFCNECGNCDTFCPEYGGPYIEKPSFFGTLESFHAAAPRDGFVAGRGGDGDWIVGRVKGVEYQLRVRGDGAIEFEDGVVRARLDADSWQVSSVEWAGDSKPGHVIDMWAVHTLRHLLAGVLDASRSNQVNVAFVASK